MSGLQIELVNPAEVTRKRLYGTGGAGHVADAISLVGFSQGTLSVSSTGAQTASLDAGLYDVWCDEADVYVQVDTTASDVTTSTGYKIAQGNVVTLYIPSDGYKLGGVTVSVSGTLRYHRVK